MFQRGMDLTRIILLTQNEFPRPGGASVGFSPYPSAVQCRKYPHPTQHPLAQGLLDQVPWDFPLGWVAGPLACAAPIS